MVLPGLRGKRLGACLFIGIPQTHYDPVEPLTEIVGPYADHGIIGSLEIAVMVTLAPPIFFIATASDVWCIGFTWLLAHTSHCISFAYRPTTAIVTGFDLSIGSRLPSFFASITASARCAAHVIVMGRVVAGVMVGRLDRISRLKTSRFISRPDPTPCLVVEEGLRQLYSGTSAARPPPQVLGQGRSSPASAFAGELPPAPQSERINPLSPQEFLRMSVMQCLFSPFKVPLTALYAVMMPVAARPHTAAMPK